MRAQDPAPSRGHPKLHQANSNNNFHIVRQLNHQNHAIHDDAKPRRSCHTAPTGDDIPICKGAPAYTDDLRRILLPSKFRADLLCHYDHKANPMEFI